ncbi:MAG TPA: pyridoxal-phosphate dependent enzyme [Chitinophagaceae bacterium]|jgi:1-aminocyclopropane-1-carboxylate deaminase
MQNLLFETITTDDINLDLLQEKNIKLSILRLDKIHPVISGNKWFKLNYYLKKATEQGKNRLVTFGGAYSNHIIATAAAGKLLGFETAGIIRGEMPEILSHTLLQAAEYGMELIFLNRVDFRNKIIPDEIKYNPDIDLIIEEGGYGVDGAKGASEVLKYCKKEIYSHIACAVGTSTMMAGLIKACAHRQVITGISVLKNNNEAEKDLINLLSPEERERQFQILHNYHFGGYAKYNAALIGFMNEFYKKTGLPSDFVYTGKLFFGIVDMIRNNSFPNESNILLIHSGGLQGNLSLPKGTLIF